MTRGECAVLALRWQATGPGGAVQGTGMTGAAARRAAAELS